MMSLRKLEGSFPASCVGLPFSMMDRMKDKMDNWMDRTIVSRQCCLAFISPVSGVWSRCLEKGECVPSTEYLRPNADLLDARRVFVLRNK